MTKDNMAARFARTIRNLLIPLPVVPSYDENVDPEIRRIEREMVRALRAIRKAREDYARELSKQPSGKIANGGDSQREARPRAESRNGASIPSTPSTLFLSHNAKRAPEWPGGRP